MRAVAARERPRAGDLQGDHEWRTGRRASCTPSAPACSPRRTRAHPNGASAGRHGRRRYRPLPGSTSHDRRGCFLNPDVDRLIRLDRLRSARTRRGRAPSSRPCSTSRSSATSAAAATSSRSSSSRTVRRGRRSRRRSPRRCCAASFRAASSSVASSAVPTTAATRLCRSRRRSSPARASSSGSPAS